MEVDQTVYKKIVAKINAKNASTMERYRTAIEKERSQSPATASDKDLKKMSAHTIQTDAWKLYLAEVQKTLPPGWKATLMEVEEGKKLRLTQP